MLKTRIKTFGRIPEYLTVGKVYDVVDGHITDDDGDKLTYMGSLRCAHIQGYWEVVEDYVPNRDFLRDFVKMNKIKTTRVSKALGKSQNWLTQMMNDKRRDMTDETLKSIMKQLHIDWASNEFLHVRSEVPYRTRPANYKTTQHKERLQRDFWNGLVTKA